MIINPNLWRYIVTGKSAAQEQFSHHFFYGDALLFFFLTVS